MTILRKRGPAKSRNVEGGRSTSQKHIKYQYARASIENPTRYAPAPLLGDHSVSDPPDPISNSAVKPDSANGTVAQAPEE